MCSLALRLARNLEHFREVVEEVDGVGGAGRGFRVELAGEIGKCGVTDAFYRVVVGV